MKRILPFLTAVLLLATACSNDGPNAPDNTSSDSQSLLKIAEQMDMSVTQLAFMDEMYYGEEDLGVLLNAQQQDLFESFFNGSVPHPMAMAGDRRMGFDMGGFMYLQLILKANPDLSETDKQALIDLIKEYAGLRMEAILGGQFEGDALRAELQRLHDELIAKMNDIIGTEGVANVEALKAQIEAEREQRRQEMIQRRINMEVQHMNALLGLTDEQITTLTGWLQDYYAGLEALRGQGLTPEELRAAIEALRETLQNHIHKDLGLTQEQLDLLARLRDWRQHRGEHRGGIIRPRG
jgi:hypothetical protein